MAERDANQGDAGTAAAAKGFSLISDEKLLDIYGSMVKSRMLAKRVCTMAPESEEARRTKAAIGREASIVGVTIDLGSEDTIVHSYGALVVDFIKGPPLNTISGESRNGAKELSIEARLGSATEAARANKERKNGKVAVIFLGDEAVPAELLWETLRVAGDQMLPVLFVCQNGLQGVIGKGAGEVGTLEGSPDTRLCGVPRIPVDGSDAVAVYRVGTESIALARKGMGPTLIECLNHPKLSPTNSEREMVDGPILQMEGYLKRKGLLEERWKQRLMADFSTEIERII